MRFAVIYDACVLYPAPLRDLLVRLATTGLFAARWTDQIHDEWVRNLIAKRPELEPHLSRTRQLMNEAVEDSLVTGHEPLIQGLTLPDPDDRHVLAAAIRAGAQLIITFNLKDFPSATLDSFGIEAVHPDAFILQQKDRCGIPRHLGGPGSFAHYRPTQGVSGADLIRRTSPPHSPRRSDKQPQGFNRKAIVRYETTTF
ncbi:MAG: PIN domain-containing protein [Pseudomonadota bacterium]